MEATRTPSQALAHAQRMLALSSATSAQAGLRGRTVVVPLIPCPHCQATVRYYVSNTEDHEGWVFYRCPNHSVSNTKDQLILFLAAVFPSRWSKFTFLLLVCSLLGVISGFGRWNILHT